MRWVIGFIGLVACDKTSEHASAVNSEKVAAAPEKSAPEADEPAVSAEPTESAEPVANAEASVTAAAAKPKPLSNAEALAKELDALDMKPIGSIGGQAAPAGSSSTTTLKTATGEASTGAAVSGPPGADAVIAANRWRFRACYTKQLAVDPAAAGTVKVSVTTDADGVVTSATHVSTTAPAMLSTCTATAFKSMKFQSGAASKFTVPVVFTAKN